MDALDVGIVGVGIAAAPLTKPLYITQLSTALAPVTPTGNQGTGFAQGVVAVASTIGGLGLMYFGRNNDMIRYAGDFFTGYGVGVALDAPYNANGATPSINSGQKVTINRNVVPPRRNAEPGSIGLKGAGILI